MAPLKQEDRQGRSVRCSRSHFDGRDGDIVRGRQRHGDGDEERRLLINRKCN